MRFGGCCLLGMGSWDELPASEHCDGSGGSTCCSATLAQLGPDLELSAGGDIPAAGCRLSERLVGRARSGCVSFPILGGEPTWLQPLPWSGGSGGGGACWTQSLLQLACLRPRPWPLRCCKLMEQVALVSPGRRGISADAVGVAEHRHRWGRRECRPASQQFALGPGRGLDSARVVGLARDAGLGRAGGCPRHGPQTHRDAALRPAISCSSIRAGKACTA